MQKSNLIPRAKARESAPDYVIDQIRHAMMENRIKPGDKLPSETELVELYGVSRGSIRQAMKSLEMLGVISIRPGDGSYVNNELSAKSLNPLAFSLLMLDPSSESIRTARYCLESDILLLVINNGRFTSELIPELEKNIEKQKCLMDQHAPLEEQVANDQAFHRLLSASCGNPIMQTIYDYVMDCFSFQIMQSTNMQLKSKFDSESIKDTVDYHSTILEALKSGDPVQIKQAVDSSMSGWGELIAALD